MIDSPAVKGRAVIVIATGEDEVQMEIFQFSGP